MSYDISLNCPCCGRAVSVPRHSEGGTICFNVESGEAGTVDADMSITYNYSKHFSFRELHCKKAEDTIPALKAAVERLGTTKDNDYWAPTPGNAGHACAVLLGWAEAYPEALWNVS